MIGDVRSRRTTGPVLFSFSILALSVLFMVAFSPYTDGAAPSVVSGSTLNLDDNGKIAIFTIWIEFPVPVDTEQADKKIGLYVPSVGEWKIGDQDFPYDINWSEDGKRLEISSGDHDLGGPYSITATIDTSITSMVGDPIWSDERSELVLTFGDTNRMTLDYGPVEIFLFFIMPFFILILVIMAIEVVLRFTMSSKKKGKIDPTAETLLRLIDRSEGMLRMRLIVTLSLTVLVIALYIMIVLVALINSMFAMVMTWAVFLFLSPWVIAVISSGLYLVYRREDIAWRIKLKKIRNEQRRFLDNGRE